MNDDDLDLKIDLTVHPEDTARVGLHSFGLTPYLNLGIAENDEGEVVFTIDAGGGIASNESEEDAKRDLALLFAGLAEAFGFDFEKE